MVANKLQLKVGGKYKTREGRVAEIEDFRECGFYPFAGRCDGRALSWTASGNFFSPRPHPADLVEEIVEAPQYRYFRWHEDSRSGKMFIIWRNALGERLVEGRLPNRPGDDWTGTSLSLTDDLLSNPDIIECDAEGHILGRPEPESLTTGQRTQIAKLAARIVLADGPVLTVDELAGMTVAELVGAIVDCDYQL